MKMARIGFIGAGNFISAFHLLTVRDCPFMKIAAVADLDEAKLRKHSDRMPIGYTTTDYRRLLDDPDIDIVIIGTKQDLHAKLIVESLDAGKWVLCEKPMAETIEETKAVLAAEKRAKGKLAIGFNRRFAPAYREAKRIMSAAPRPWFMHYRLMWPSAESKGPGSFYWNHEHILYEGSHILDLANWMLDSAPSKVYMTGERMKNNCCILSYPDGSQVTFMTGGLGTYCLWKEYMELFAAFRTITVSDFIDMRVRGVEGEFDRLHGTYMGEHAADVKKYGFDFFEAYHTARVMEGAENWRKLGMTMESVRRPLTVPFDVTTFKHENPDCWSFIPNKGWKQAVEHFANCFLNGETPGNADGRAGALSTQIALDLLRSLDSGQAVDMTPVDSVV